MSAQPTTQIILLTLQYAYDLILVHEDELGQLDAAAGDGDHGAAMVRGLRAAVAAAQANAAAPPDEQLALAGAAFADEGGGASGALFGSWITAIGQQLGPSPDSAAQVVDALQVSLDLLCTLGKAKPGDKTLIDALAPFVQALREQVAAGQPLAVAWQAALPAAEAGAEATAQMIAKRGRSSRLGERSLGHRDPGAVSMTYFLQAAGQALVDVCGV